MPGRTNTSSKKRPRKDAKEEKGWANRGKRTFCQFCKVQVTCVEF